jgi:hypothetical protein
MEYAIATQGINGEEYMREPHGDDCFTDDIGLAILYKELIEMPSLRNIDYVVLVDNDEENGIYVVGKLIK